MEQLVQQLDQLRLSTENKSAVDDPEVKDIVETYAKAVCDCTFFHENYLTERDFKDATAEKDVRNIIMLFNAVATLCASVDKKASKADGQQYKSMSNIAIASLSAPYELQSVFNVLGLDYAECLPWRQGSLLYAFLNCKLNTDASWVDNNQITFLNYLHEAINYLQAMLNFRKPEKSGDQAIISFDFNEHPSVPSDGKAPINEDVVEAIRKDLLQKQQELGAEGQDLEHMQEILEHQHEINEEALLDINQQLHQEPHLEEVLQEVQMEVQQQQQEVLDKQEDRMEQKEQLQEKLLQLQLQQQQLQTMMKQLKERRRAMTEPEIVESGDPDTLRLVELGIFSDPHLLAVMYSGEMAYWYCLHADKWSIFGADETPATADDNESVISQLRSLGRSMLSLYIEAVNSGGLVKAGWSSDRARELLVYFNTQCKR